MAPVEAQGVTVKEGSASGAADAGPSDVSTDRSTIEEIVADLKPSRQLQKVSRQLGNFFCLVLFTTHCHLFVCSPPR